MAKGKTITITVSELRAHLPEILHRVLLKGETFIITKHGLPFAQLRPLNKKERSVHIRFVSEEFEDLTR